MKTLRIRIAAVLLLWVVVGTAPAAEHPMRTVAVPPDCPAPVFPNSTARPGDLPVTVFAFRLDGKGSVLESKVLVSSGVRAFDEAARLALVRCRYAPARADGRPARSWVRVHFEWVID